MLLLPTIITLWLTALPSLPAMPITPSSPLHKRDPKCHDIPRHLTTPLKNLDCIHAVYELPTTQLLGGVVRNPTEQVGTFSLDADPATQFRLPRHFAYGSCMVGVTMANMGVIRDEDSESWDHIAREALAIVRQCVQQPPLEDKVGGTVFVGVHGSIQVDVFLNQRHLKFLVDLNKPPSQGPVTPPSPGPALSSS